MGFQARERVEKNFSWESIARQTFKFYQELTEGRKNYSSNAEEVMALSNKGAE